MSVEQAVKYLKTQGILVHEAAQEKYAERLALVQNLFGGFINERAFSDDIDNSFSYGPVEQDCTDFYGSWYLQGGYLSFRTYNESDRVEVATVPPDYSEYMLGYVADLSNEQLSAWDVGPLAQLIREFCIRFYLRNETLRIRDKPYFHWAIYTLDRLTLEHVPAETVEVVPEPEVAETFNIMGGTTKAWPFTPNTVLSTTSTVAAPYVTSGTTSTAAPTITEDLLLEMRAMRLSLESPRMTAEHWKGALRAIAQYGADIASWPVASQHLNGIVVSFGFATHEWPTELHAYLNELRENTHA